MAFFSLNRYLNEAKEQPAWAAVYFLVELRAKKERSRRAVLSLLKQHIKEEKLYSDLMRKLLHVKKPFSMLSSKSEDSYIILGNSYKKINNKNK